MRIRIEQVKSTIGRLDHHKRVLEGLGLRGIGQAVEHDDVPTIRGMINKVSYLVKVSGVK